MVYTTNAVESLNMTLRKLIKTRGSFPTEEAAFKLLFMGLRNVSKKWSFIQGWREALNRFQIMWPERMPWLIEADGGGAPSNCSPSVRQRPNRCQGSLRRAQSARP